MTARRVIIAGRVQGVGYREWMRRHAESLGLSGWVRNLQNGAVEALIDGEEAAVEELLRRCRRGPPLASVTEIVEELTDPPDTIGFSRRPNA